MVKHYVLTLTGSQQLLSSVLPEGSGDPPIRWLSMQAKGANSGIVYYGGAGQVVSSSAYMGRIEVPVTTIPSAPTIVELSESATSLSQWKVIGTNNDVLLIGVID